MICIIGILKMSNGFAKSYDAMSLMTTLSNHFLSIVFEIVKNLQIL